ncbi:MAG: radical SAM protein, partial [Thermodesulfobacteriota bacterium]|nr:radical SAM protein [Thermodesulfobacteriota bacterium]
TLKMLKDAGLERIEVGIQSGSQRIRKEIFERPVSDKTLIKVANRINQFNIVPFYDLIVDNPFEADEDKRQSLDFILKLPRPFHLRMFPLTYFPNTKLTKLALSSKLISQDQVESVAERTHNKWFVTLDYPWSNRERFWISLFSLTSKDFIPKVLIRFLSQSRFLQRYPRLLSSFATLANNIKLGTIAIKWILEGKPLKAIFRQTSKGRSHWQI